MTKLLDPSGIGKTVGELLIFTQDNYETSIKENTQVNQLIIQVKTQPTNDGKSKT